MDVYDTFHAALQEPRRYRMAHWARSLEQHRHHAEFRTASWAFSREAGFTCGCTGCDQEWRIELTSLRALIPQVRDRYLRIHNRSQLAAGSKKRRREERVANRKAKALLHSQLTREQRWQLRAEKAFTVVGQDGQTYLITEGSSSNVRLLENGEATLSFCIIAKDLWLPVYDLMLAQKLMLEASPEEFHKLAVVRDLREEPAAADEDIVIAEEDLEDPARWVRQRIAI